MSQLLYNTPAGITVTRTSSKAPYRRGLGKLLKRLDTERGAYLSSGYEYPERYSRWDVATVTPPIQIVGRNRTLTFEALNERGEQLVKILSALLGGHPHVKSRSQTHSSVALELHPLAERFPEEERSKQPSYFSLLRAMVHEFDTPEDSKLVLIGAFGYDLLLEFDPIRLQLPRDNTKDLHLFLCDDIYFMDRK
jgi:anthranilate synthase